VQLVVRDVRYNSRREIRLQVLVEKLLLVWSVLDSQISMIRVPSAGLGPPAWDMKSFAERSNGISGSSVEA
jgi:hypothetical protein